MKKIYQRKCINKACKKKFTPALPNQIVCSGLCGVEYAKAVNVKKWQKEKKERKEKLKSRTDHLNELQVVFNRFVRTRDQKLPCISCGSELKGKFDAGHFFSVGAHPELRFWEDNCHGQCVYCNQHRHGNLLEYAENLPKRIGPDRYSILLAAKGSHLKLTLPDILEWKERFKNKIKELKITPTV
jgi:hypothetical protein